MVQAWWAAPPVAAAILFNSVFRRKSSRRSKKDDEASRDETGLSFSCERVCTSDTLLKRLGSLAKARGVLLCCVLPPCAPSAAAEAAHALRYASQEPTPNTCVTVCGVSSASGPAASKPLCSKRLCVAWRETYARTMRVQARTRAQKPASVQCA